MEPQNKNIAEDSDQEVEFFIKRNQNKQQSQKKTPGLATDVSAEKPDSTKMDIEGKAEHIPTTTTFKFHDLPEEVEFYLIEVFALGNRLFISGVLSNGQTINFMADQTKKELYFCLKEERPGIDEVSEEFKKKAEKQIRQRFREVGLKQFQGCWTEKEYVFEIDGVPRGKRPYFQVRYPFRILLKEDPKPDWSGETFKYVFGTTYTPLQLFVINTGMKGPGWAKIEKKYLTPNTQNSQKLCVNIREPEFIQRINKEKPSTMRVMSLSVKAVVPSQLKVKRYFKTQNSEDVQIYAIAYTFCKQYDVELKPNKYNTFSRVYYVKGFGSMNESEYVLCEDEKRMIGRFEADLSKFDPDIIVCHDSSKIMDTLIQRMMKIYGKQDKPQLGRLIYSHQISKANQLQRINSCIAGRLLCDTYVHSKDMIKSVDYELESMSKYIKPDRVFKGMSDQETKQILNENQPAAVLRKAKQEAQVTFALMNHLEVLQITRSLSTICGNLWRRSLQNQRAERNEFLIMHECSRRDLIIPDKFRKVVDQGDEVDRKKYQGGHVIQPQKGIYRDFILLLDFNSLYPSIIREYNVCFSKIKRPFVPLTAYYKDRSKKGEKDKVIKEEHQKMDIEEPQIGEMTVQPPSKEECVRQLWGFLPQLIDKIVKRRQQCKAAMKKASAERTIILDIQQKCYKLVANSIYGCLGFSISRFYSKHLASLITRMGRQALLRAKDIVTGMQGVQVIYGDTDSLMIQPTALSSETDKQKLFEIKGIADALKKLINKEYVNLQIDVDGIFKPLMLLMKKKYVARKLLNFQKVLAIKLEEPAYNIQYKGIEVVRRDGFQLARDTLKKILEILMESSDKKEQNEIYEMIYQYMKDLRARFSSISFKDFLFSKQLNKAPKEYNKPETMPHVKVAMDRIKRGQQQATLINHTIYYIVCKPRDTSYDGLAKNCYDDRTYERSQKQPNEKDRLQIDEDYYKRQLLQPIGRITMHLQDFDNDRLCEELGVSDDGRKKFKKQMENERDQGEVKLQGAIIHNKEDKSKKFDEIFGQVECLCGQKMSFTEKGTFRMYCGCGRNLATVIYNRIHFYIKKRIAEYYSNKLKCKCGKQWILTPTSKCCKINYRIRSNIPFQLHETIYICRDICELTLKSGLDEKSEKKMVVLQNLLVDFMQASEFQKLDGLMGVLQL